MKLIIRTFKPICDSFSVSIGFYLVSKRILATNIFLIYLMLNMSVTIYLPICRPGTATLA